MTDRPGPWRPDGGPHPGPPPGRPASYGPGPSAPPTRRLSTPGPPSRPHDDGRWQDPGSARGPARPGRGPRVPRTSGGAVAAAVVLGLGAAIVTFSDHLGIDHRTPFVQTIAFRPQLAAALVLLAALVAWRARGAWPVALALGLVGVVGLAIVLPRGFGSAEAGATGGPELTVLTASAYLSRADPQALASLILARAPDVVVLPEARGSLRDSLQEALVDESGGEGGRSGYRAYSADAENDDSPMTVFVSRGMGRPKVTPDRDTEFPSLIVDIPDADGQQVRVVATHPQSPRPGDTKAWRRDVAALSRWCTGDRPTVVAGDLNSTLDHAELRDAIVGCTDAASDVGEGLTGTWPAMAPRILGVQIDHVLVSGGPRARDVEVVDVEGSDHRGVLARVGLG